MYVGKLTSFIISLPIQSIWYSYLLIYRKSQTNVGKYNVRPIDTFGTREAFFQASLPLQTT